MFCLIAELCRDSRRLSVPDRVLYGFLTDVQELLLGLSWKQPWYSVHREIETDRPAFHRALTGVPNRASEIPRVQGGRPQLPDRMPCILDVAFDVLADADDVLPDRRRRDLETVRQVVELQGNRHESLQKAVMNRPAHTHALGEHERELL